MSLRVELFAALRDQSERGAAFPQQCFVFTGQTAPGTQCVEPVVEAVLVDEGGEGADLLQPLGWWHQDSAVATQPTPVVQTVLGDEAHVTCDVVAQPLVDLPRIEILTVGMADRKVMRADFAAGAVSDTDSTDMPSAPGPRRTTVREQAFVLALGIDRDDADATQIG